MINIDDEIKGLFLLILAISGNFIGETLGCKTQKLIGENMLVKHFFIMTMVFFALSFTSNSVISPTTHIYKALFVWLFYVLFTKMNMLFTTLTFFMLLAIYICNEYISYYKKTKDNEEKIEKIEKMKQVVSALSIICICIGFVLYFFKQHREHKKNFSMIKFLFGVRKCDSL
jgi:hypothetical protein